MEFYTYQFSSWPSSSSSSSFAAVCLDRFRQLTVKAVTGYLISAILAFFFAVVGTLLGAITGAIIGQESESGLVRGAVVGAISGALLSIEVFETFRRLWQTNGNAYQCLLYLIDLLVSLVSGRLVRERVGPMMFNAVQSEIGAIEPSFVEVFDIFETGGCKGLSGDIVAKIPKIEITTNNHVDSWGDRISCSVCLQEFQLGEKVRNLPYCHHKFHLTCIDRWLIKHGSCPLCRRDL